MRMDDMAKGRRKQRRRPKTPEECPMRHAEALLERLPTDVPLAGAEIGVYRGWTSEKLLAQRPNLCTLYLVDSWQGRREPSKEEAERRTGSAADRRCVLHMDSLVAATKVEDGSLDFVFIDADHSYEAVRADIRAWLPKLKPGGLLCGHDYLHPKCPGVAMAVDEAVAEHGWHLELGATWSWFVRLPTEGGGSTMKITGTAKSGIGKAGRVIVGDKLATRAALVGVERLVPGTLNVKVGSLAEALKALGGPDLVVDEPWSRVGRLLHCWGPMRIETPGGAATGWVMRGENSKAAGLEIMSPTHFRDMGVKNGDKVVITREAVS